jgi:hypothetical protein
MADYCTELHLRWTGIGIFFILALTCHQRIFGRPNVCANRRPASS